MDDKEKAVLQQVHCQFVESLDPVYVIDFLYQNGALSKQVCEEITNIEFRGNRARKFMFLVSDIDTVTMEILYEALKSNGYDFLAELLYDKSKNDIPIQRKAEFFNRFRKELVKYRHYLKRLTHSGHHKRFESEFFKAKANWESVKRMKLQNKRHKKADIYFFALDAWCEYRRVIYDKSFVDTNVFDEIDSLKPYLSEENLPEMMRLARYGSAVLMTDKNKINKALQYIDDAKTKFDLIYACRETGTVLYIEYNMLCQKYAETLSPDLKRLLDTIGNRAIEHFSREIECYDTVYYDFRRMVLLKLSHLYLGIGMFGVYLDAEVTIDDKRKAVSLLRFIRTNKEIWSRMETRWKWSYYAAKGRLFGIQNDIQKAIKHTSKALSFAERGGYTREIVGSKNALKIFENKSIILNIRGEDPTNSKMPLSSCDVQLDITSIENKISDEKRTNENPDIHINWLRRRLQQRNKETERYQKKLKTMNLKETEFETNIQTQNRQEYSFVQFYPVGIVSLILVMSCLCLIVCCLVLLLLLYNERLQN